MKQNKIMIIGLTIIAIFVIGCIDSFFSETETEFQIYKDDVDINTIVNITPEELNRYPALKSALNGEVCVSHGGYYKQITGVKTPIGSVSLCKVTREDWNKIQQFIDSKRIYDPDRGTCYKFDEIYGDTCYSFGFARP